MGLKHTSTMKKKEVISKNRIGKNKSLLNKITKHHYRSRYFLRAIISPKRTKPTSSPTKEPTAVIP